jgi:hypothetical protein
MTTTHADFLVRSGPTLQVLTGQAGFNTAVETIWAQWATAIQFRRKLWVMAHAKTQDGEPIAIIRENPRVAHPVTLDLVVCETEQCQTPLLPYGERGYIDGIKFDQWGNPEWYDLLYEHPGSSWSYSASLEAEKVPADWVLHWFLMKRGGQHRGIPELTSTHNLGAAGRRHRESTLAAAEAARAELQSKPAAWVCVTQALPKSGVKVLACYRNRLGKLRRIRAHWIAAKTVEASSEDWDQCSEYDEATDTYYVTEGWYECIDNWGDYSAVAVSEGDVTHWMALPEAPAE